MVLSAHGNYVMMCEAELRWIQQFCEGLEQFRIGE